jgi:hypothetical protein
MKLQLTVLLEKIAIVSIELCVNLVKKTQWQSMCVINMSNNKIQQKI